MNVSEMTLRLILLFIPGVICSYIVEALTVHRPRDKFFFVIKTVFLAMSAYASYWSLLKVLRFLCPSHSYTMTFLHSLSDPTIALSYPEVLRVCIVGILLALLVAAFLNHKILYRIAWKLRVSKKIGDLDIWAFTLNSDISDWVTVRAIDSDVVYEGWVRAYSDDGTKKEILLHDVSVYRNKTGGRLYQTGAAYIDCTNGNFIIEFRGRPIRPDILWKEDLNNDRGK